MKRVVEASVLGLRLENCHFTLHRIRSFAGDSAETMMGIDEDGLIRRYMHAKSRPMYVNGTTRARITRCRSECSSHSPCGADERFFKTDVNFSNTLLAILDEIVRLIVAPAISSRGNRRTHGLRAIGFCSPAAIQEPTKCNRGCWRVFVSP